METVFGHEEPWLILNPDVGFRPFFVTSFPSQFGYFFIRIGAHLVSFDMQETASSSYGYITH